MLDRSHAERASPRLGRRAVAAPRVRRCGLRHQHERDRLCVRPVTGRCRSLHEERRERRGEPRRGEPAPERGAAEVRRATRPPRDDRRGPRPPRLPPARRRPLLRRVAPPTARRRRHVEHDERTARRRPRRAAPLLDAAEADRQRRSGGARQRGPRVRRMGRDDAHAQGRDRPPDHEPARARRGVHPRPPGRQPHRLRDVPSRRGAPPVDRERLHLPRLQARRRHARDARRARGDPPPLHRVRQPRPALHDDPRPLRLRRDHARRVLPRRRDAVAI